VFLQVAVDDATLTETATLDRGPARVLRLERPWLRRPRDRVARALKSAIGLLLRALGLALFASPTFAVGRFFAAAFGLPALADLFVVAFVLLVVAFFGVLNLFVLASFMVWAIRRFTYRPALVPPHPSAALPSAPPVTERSALGDRVLARGTVVALQPRAEQGPVLRDAWSETERRTEADDFAIRRGRGEAPVVVRLETAPLVLGAQEVHEGDEVIAVGRLRAIAPSAERIELGGETRKVPRDEADGEGAPYRRAAAGPAFVIGDAIEEPVTIAVVRARR
jgi:hypothetical protein